MRMSLVSTGKMQSAASLRFRIVFKRCRSWSRSSTASPAQSTSTAPSVRCSRSATTVATTTSAPLSRDSSKHSTPPGGGGSAHVSQRRLRLQAHEPLPPLDGPPHLARPRPLGVRRSVEARDAARHPHPPHRHIPRTRPPQVRRLESRTRDHRSARNIRCRRSRPLRLRPLPPRHPRSLQPQAPQGELRRLSAARRMQISGTLIQSFVLLPAFKEVKHSLQSFGFSNLSAHFPRPSL